MFSFHDVLYDMVTFGSDREPEWGARPAVRVHKLHEGKQCVQSCLIYLT